MAQQNLAFITGQSSADAALETALVQQLERYVALGRRNVVIVLDTFPDLGDTALAALQRLLCRAFELQAKVSCVSTDERIAHRLRHLQASYARMRIIERVDQIPA